MSDERYERSADMRLLELQREAMGVPPRVVGTTSYTDPDPLGDAANKDDDDAFVQSGTILIAALDAQPRTGLIAGAVVTVSVSIANDGDAPARDVRLTLPLPADTAYRPGTLALDGNPTDDGVANDLFAEGAALGDIEPGARRTLVAKLLIEAGGRDIILTPHLAVASGAVLGLRAMRLTRGAASAGAAAELRPFYESDEVENAREAFVAPEPRSTIAVLQPREIPPAPELEPAPPGAVKPAKPPLKAVPPAAAKPAPAVAPKMLKAAAPKPAVAKPAAVAAPNVAPSLSDIVVDLPTTGPSTKASPKTRAKATPKAKAKPKAKAVPRSRAQTASGAAAAPQASTAAGAAVRVADVTKIEVIRSADDSIAVEGLGGPMLTVSVDRKRLATLTRLFSGPSLGMIAHYLMLNALAAKDALPGDGTDCSIAAFVTSQEQLLSRALITTRLGKTPLPGSVGAALPPLPPPLSATSGRRTIATGPPGEAILVRAFTPGDVAYLQRSVTNPNSEPFLRAAQLFVGLCANDAVVADDGWRRDTQVALTAYAALATAEIGRIFLRGRLNRTPELFKGTDETFDDAARTVLATLGRLIA